MSASVPASAIERTKDETRAVISAELQDLFDDGAVLALEVAGLHAGRRDVRLLLHLDAETALGVCVSGAGDPTVQADETDGRDAARQAHTFGDLSDRADLCVFPLVSWHEQDAVLLADIRGDRDIHVREDDGVV